MRDRAAGKIIGNNRARSSEYQAECSKTFRDQFFRKHAALAYTGSPFMRHGKHPA
jgi:hypothetical protein